MRIAGDVIIAEPQCQGQTHVPFNSALVVTASLAWPQSRLTFLGEGSHVARVGRHLEEHEEAIGKRMHWERFEDDEVLEGNRRPWGERLRRLSRALTLGRVPDWSQFIFASLDGLDLVLLKFLLLKHRERLRVRCILHAVMRNASRGAVGAGAILFRRALVFGNSAMNLRFVVLAPTIAEHVVRSVPKVAPFLAHIDHPYLFPGGVGRVGSEAEWQARGLRLAFLGADSTGKGFGAFIQLAGEVAAHWAGPQALRPSFHGIGFRTGGSPEQSTLETQLSRAPLTSAEYSSQLSRMDYVIFPYSAEHYTFTASGAMLDALASAKPCIALRNPLFANYFARMGDVGYICDSYEEMWRLVGGLCAHPPVERYVRQCEAIGRGRAIFRPDRVAPLLGRAMAE